MPRQKAPKNPTIKYPSEHSSEHAHALQAAGSLTLLTLRAASSSHPTALDIASTPFGIFPAVCLEQKIHGVSNGEGLMQRQPGWQHRPLASCDETDERHVFTPSSLFLAWGFVALKQQSGTLVQQALSAITQMLDDISGRLLPGDESYCLACIDIGEVVILAGNGLRELLVRFPGLGEFIDAAVPLVSKAIAQGAA